MKKNHVYYGGVICLSIGILPAAVLWLDIIQAPPACSQPLRLSPYQHVSIRCGEYPSAYPIMAVAFTLLVIAGVALLVWQRRRSRQAA